MLFMEQLLRLLKPTGRGSVIVPNSWLTIESAKLLRQTYLNRLESVADLNYPPFHGVSLEPCIFTVSGSDIKRPIGLVRVHSAEELISATFQPVERIGLQKHNRIVFHGSGKVSDLIEHIIANSKPLGILFNARSGLQAYERGRGTPPQTAADVKNHVFDRPRRENADSVQYLV